MCFVFDVLLAIPATKYITGMYHYIHQQWHLNIKSNKNTSL